MGLLVPPAWVTASLPPFTEIQRSVNGGKDRDYVRQDPEHCFNNPGHTNTATKRDFIGTRVQFCRDVDCATRMQIYKEKPTPLST
jgi:hypothetical protein